MSSECWVAQETICDPGCDQMIEYNRRPRSVHFFFLSHLTSPKLVVSLCNSPNRSGILGPQPITPLVRHVQQPTRPSFCRADIFLEQVI